MLRLPEKEWIQEGRYKWLSFEQNHWLDYCKQQLRQTVWSHTTEHAQRTTSSAQVSTSSAQVPTSSSPPPSTTVHGSRAEDLTPRRGEGEHRNQHAENGGSLQQRETGRGYCNHLADLQRTVPTRETAWECQNRQADLSQETVQKGTCRANAQRESIERATRQRPMPRQYSQ